jgi:hypothetical protein
VTPGALPESGGYYKPGGLPLSATETIAVFVAEEGPPVDYAKEPGHRFSPIGARASATKGFMGGFHTARPDVQVVTADEALRKACFDQGTKSIFQPGGVLLRADPNAADCHALVQQRGIRYLVSAGGYVWTKPVELSGTSWKQTHIFNMTARAIDTTSGGVVCEEWHSADAIPTGSVGLVYVVPVITFQVVDESAYLTHVGWYTGHKVGSCFVQPGEQK